MLRMMRTLPLLPETVAAGFLLEHLFSLAYPTTDGSLLCIGRDSYEFVLSLCVGMTLHRFFFTCEGWISFATRCACLGAYYEGCVRCAQRSSREAILRLGQWCITAMLQRVRRWGTSPPRQRAAQGKTTNKKFDARGRASTSFADGYVPDYRHCGNWMPEATCDTWHGQTRFRWTSTTWSQFIGPWNVCATTTVSRWDGCYGTTHEGREDLEQGVRQWPKEIRTLHALGCEAIAGYLQFNR